MSFGLTQLKGDIRDFSYSLFFGHDFEIPTVEFTVSDPLEIKDQGTSDMCTAYALSSVSEDQEKKTSAYRFLLNRSRCPPTWQRATSTGNEFAPKYFSVLAQIHNI